MVLKVAANLNFLFKEFENLAERIYMAHKAGFRAVEIPFTWSEQQQVIEAQKKTKIEIALINIAVDFQNFEFGCASIPGAERTFEKHLRETIKLAKKLSCNKIHIMSGIMREGDFEVNLETYKSNLKKAALILEKENIIGLIEPINKYSLPSYFMNSYDTACTVLRYINSRNVKLLMDIFHLQHIQGNVTNSLIEMSDFIGHIQIAQVPHRNEPNLAGELDFAYIFPLIERLGYSGWIGCEYTPKSSVTDGLKWISTYGLQL